MNTNNLHIRYNKSTDTYILSSDTTQVFATKNIKLMGLFIKYYDPINDKLDNPSFFAEVERDKLGQVKVRER